ncbi:hypothetical protein [Clostridium formicaceticum]|uniref:Uncharacterized protein n=1 Tax=Clostridium formicaceticum TaxID=1497 RepID=A0AAC9WEX1_9CLOT|nr:hypothetical protein [Clostridium formicaceticum]AOY75760.1 hypothetical protein BJL90_07520 [Clostridium formicaceticum]ARE86084.1 hypothetical protein CLFO_04000 [Clostridium formicaceticum]
MKILKGIVKFLVYVWIIWPFTRGIIVSIFGYKLGDTVAVIVMLGLIYYFEKAKIVTGLIEKGFRKFNIGARSKGQVFDASTTAFTDAIMMEGPKTTKTCPNCGAVVELTGGRGSCDSCDTIFS